MRRLLRELIGLTLAAALVGAVQAQPQPYAGQHQREIKALSADEIKQYLAGAGMGYAKSAELNHYPGPGHALELADKLGLSDGQRRTRALLSAEQVARYDTLRGYGQQPAVHHGGKH
jgi:hypothetical protein